MNATRTLSLDAATVRHAAAVATTLGWAEDAAAGGDYGDALEWLATLEAIGDVLDDTYETKRASWACARVEERPHRRLTGGDGDARAPERATRGAR
jgi:hypothetical protein